jgi:hypothetical protein
MSVSNLSITSAIAPFQKSVCKFKAILKIAYLLDCAHAPSAKIAGEDLPHLQIVAKAVGTILAATGAAKIIAGQGAAMATAAAIVGFEYKGEL